MSGSLQAHGLQHIRLLCPPMSPRVCSNSRQLSQWWYLTISSSATLLLLPSIFLSIRVFSSGLAFSIRWPKYWSFSFSKALPMNIQGWLPLGLTGLISLLSQESSLAPQFESINSSVLSLLYGPTLTSVHDYSFDYMDFCWQSDVSAFQYAV